MSGFNFSADRRPPKTVRYYSIGRKIMKPWLMSSLLYVYINIKNRSRIEEEERDFNCIIAFIRLICI